jgi:cytochrome c biogenesis protein CcmG/thiol:disulfide interchange protein DsbE
VVTADPKPAWPRRALRFAREAALWVLLALLGLAVVGRLRAPALPERAPEFALPALDGTWVRLAELRGRPVVLNFWATWCGPCRVEIPAFARLAARRPDVTVLGIAADGTPDELRAAAAELGASYPVLRGTPEVFAAYGVTTYPTTVVLDAEGRVVHAHTGLMLDPHLSFALAASGLGM